MKKRFFVVTAILFVVFLIKGEEISYINKISKEDVEYLKTLAKDSWQCIDYFVHPVTGIPFDSNAKTDSTNTTNVGLYITSLAAAVEMGFITKKEAIDRMKKLLKRLEEYPHWKGLLNNWLSVGKEAKANSGLNIITDFNKLTAGLIVASQAFPEIADECLKFVDRNDWSILYDKKRKRDYWGYDIVNQKLDGYGMWLAADSRLSSLFKVASDGVPDELWPALKRKQIEQYGYKFYEPGWNFGGIFMQAIGGLFIDERIFPVGKSVANFAYIQMIYAKKKGLSVWGWSNCILLDGEYTEGGFLKQDVVTPHASALAIIYYPRKVIANLKKLEELGVREPLVIDGEKRDFGFRDSIELSTGLVSKTYFTGLDQAMLFISIVNFLKDGAIWKYFAQYPMVVNGIKIIKKYEKEAPSLLQIYEERDKNPIDAKKEHVKSIKKKKIDDFNKPLSENNISGNVYVTNNKKDAFQLRFIRAPGRVGALSFVYDLNKAGGCISIREELMGMDLRPFNAITFDIKGDKKHGFTKKLRVQLYDRNDVYSVCYVTGIKDKWKRIVLPFKEFYGILSDDSNVVSINFVLDKGQWFHAKKKVTNSKGKLYIDNLALETLTQEQLVQMDNKHVDKKQDVIQEGIVIDDFEDCEKWTFFVMESDFGELSQTEGQKGDGISLEYDITPAKGWATIEKPLEIKIERDFEFSFYLKKEGANPIDVEFKLVDQDGSVFGKKFINVQKIDNWKEFTIKLNELAYWWGGNDKLDDLKLVSLAVSGSKGGKGRVYFDSLKAIKSGSKSSNKSNVGLKIKKAWASTELGDNRASLSFDGDSQTRWESHGVDPSWIVYELEKETVISKIEIDWETASASVYDVQISLDGRNWKTMKSIVDGFEGESREIKFMPVRAKYIRIFGKQRATQWAYSIFEIGIYK